MVTTDSKIVARLDEKALDGIPLAIGRVSTNNVVTYLNRAAKDLIGGQIDVGFDLMAVELDPESRKELEAQLVERFSMRQGSQYYLNLVDPASGVHKRIQVTALPEYDDDGALSGSIGIIRDCSLETANLEIHKVIENASSWEVLLASLATELKKVISFDAFLVTLVSERRNHLRRLFEYPEGPRRASPIRWWPIPPGLKDLVLTVKMSAVNVQQMFSEPPYDELARSNAPTREWLLQGYKHLLRRPIYHQGRQVAVAVLQRKADVPFSQVDIQTFSELPVAEAVNMALTLDKKGEMQFWLDLIQELGERVDDPAALRQLFVDRLRSNYAWEHVVLFRLDEGRRVFRLQCQSPSILPSDYSQKFDQGWLSEVRKHKRPVVQGSLHESPGRYVQGLPNARSEMCVPIPGARLRWILNVESALGDAFADEELASVQFLLGIVGFMLDRAAIAELKASIFEAVADGVVTTSSEGVIESANPAAVRLLGLELKRLRGRRLSGFIRPPNGMTDPDLAKRITGAHKVPSTPVELARLNDMTVPVLISGAALPNELGGKVYVMSDLSHIQRSAKMDALKEVFKKIAVEMRVPLSLASAFLADASSAPDKASELAERALAQVRKADLPLERLVRLADAPDNAPFEVAPVDVCDLIGTIREQLPASYKKEVLQQFVRPQIIAKAALPELSFCLQSILAYQLRQKAQADVVRLSVAEGDNEIDIDLSVSASEPQLTRTSVMEGQGLLKDFTFPESLVKDLVERMGGSFDGRDHKHLCFRVSLPSGEKTNDREELAAAGS